MGLQFTSLDLLYLSLAVGFIVLVIFMVFIILKASKTLDRLNLLIEDVDDTAGDIRQIKNTIKSGILSATSLVLGTIFRKGGEKYAK